CRATRPTAARSGSKTGSISPRSRPETIAMRISAIALTMLFAGVPLSAQEPTVTPVTTKALTDIPGKEVLILTVHYAPGAADHPHRHNADAFVYVLEGSVVEQVKGGQPVTLTAGQTFYEGPDDIHVVGKNASQTQPAKLMAILIKKKGAPALVPEK